MGALNERDFKLVMKYENSLNVSDRFNGVLDVMKKNTHTRNYCVNGDRNITVRKYIEHIQNRNYILEGNNMVNQNI